MWGIGNLPVCLQANVTNKNWVEQNAYKQEPSQNSLSSNQHSLVAFTTSGHPFSVHFFFSRVSRDSMVAFALFVWLWPTDPVYCDSLEMDEND